MRFSCSEPPLDVDIVVPDPKVVRSGGRKWLQTFPVEELALERGAAVYHWTEFKKHSLNGKKRCTCDGEIVLLTCNSLRLLRLHV